MTTDAVRVLLAYCVDGPRQGELFAVPVKGDTPPWFNVPSPATAPMFTAEAPADRTLPHAVRYEMAERQWETTTIAREVLDRAHAAGRSTVDVLCAIGVQAHRYAVAP